MDVKDPHAAEVAALLSAEPALPLQETKKLTFANVTLAWTPFILMSVFLMLTGLIRQQEEHGTVYITKDLQTNYRIPIPTLHNQSNRDPRLHPIKMEQAAVLPIAGSNPLGAALSAAHAMRLAPKPEPALFNFAWLTAPGTAVFFAALVSMAMLRMNGRQIRTVLTRTVVQMRIPIPTIAFMLGLSYVTRYAGMDATLGFAFAKTGVFYPFFAAILGWLGVFLTGTDAGSNALFGSLQKITATEIYNSPMAPFNHLSLDQRSSSSAPPTAPAASWGK